jgi:hypothetical protein
MNNPPYVIYTIGLDREGKPSRGNPKGEARCRFISTNSGFFLDQARSTKSQAKNTPLTFSAYNIHHGKQHNFTK